MTGHEFPRPLERQIRSTVQPRSWKVKVSNFWRGAKKGKRVAWYRKGIIRRQRKGRERKRERGRARYVGQAIIHNCPKLNWVLILFRFCPPSKIGKAVSWPNFDPIYLPVNAWKDPLKKKTFWHIGKADLAGISDSLSIAGAGRGGTVLTKRAPCQ